jgi:hypothetical protein
MKVGKFRKFPSGANAHTFSRFAEAEMGAETKIAAAEPPSAVFPAGISIDSKQAYIQSAWA